MLKPICFSLNGLVNLFKFVTLIYSSGEIIKQIKYKWHAKDLHNQGHTLSFYPPTQCTPWNTANC